MNPTQHPSNNRVLGAPKNWDQGELPCSALAITDMEFGGQQCVASFWLPRPEELAELNNGGTVVLMIFGQGMPPASVGVAPRFN